MTTLANRVKPWAMDLRSRPLLDYVVILGVVFILSGLGIVMVFSSSMAVSALQDDSPWSRVVRQGVMVVVGFIAMWMGLRVRPQSIRRWSSWLLVAAFALLILVLIPGIGTGKEQWGAQSWIGVGPISIQPSELAKVAIAVWGAAYLADQKTMAGKQVCALYSGGFRHVRVDYPPGGLGHGTHHCVGDCPGVVL